jgi:hypothetical protein
MTARGYIMERIYDELLKNPQFQSDPGLYYNMLRRESSWKNRNSTAPWMIWRKRSRRYWKWT